MNFPVYVVETPFDIDDAETGAIEMEKSRALPEPAEWKFLPSRIYFLIINKFSSLSLDSYEKPIKVKVNVWHSKSANS